MRNLPEDIAARLYDLLSGTAFGDLSEADAAFVLQHLTETEYEHLRQLEAGVHQSLLSAPASAKPDPALQGRLQAALRQKHARSRGVAWWQRPVPAYQLAVAALLPVLFFYASALWQTNPPIPATPPVQVVYQKIVDTLYLPAREVKAQMLQAVKPIDVLREQKSKRASRSVPKVEPAEVLAPQAEALPMLALQPFVPSAPSNKGFASRSLSDDSALTRFIVKVN